jgi:hypothetical protein
MSTTRSAVLLPDKAVPLWSVLLQILINGFKYAVSHSAVIRQLVPKRNKLIAIVNFKKTVNNEKVIKLLLRCCGYSLVFVFKRSLVQTTETSSHVRAFSWVSQSLQLNDGTASYNRCRPHFFLPFISINVHT